MYSCAKCGLAVIVIPAKPRRFKFLKERKPVFIRACKCDAGVVVNLSADMHGHGGLVA